MPPDLVSVRKKLDMIINHLPHESRPLHAMLFADGADGLLLRGSEFDIDVAAGVTLVLAGFIVDGDMMDRVLTEKGLGQGCLRYFHGSKLSTQQTAFRTAALLRSSFRVLLMVETGILLSWARRVRLYPASSSRKSKTFPLEKPRSINWRYAVAKSLVKGFPIRQKGLKWDPLPADDVWGLVNYCLQAARFFIWVSAANDLMSFSSGLLISLLFRTLMRCRYVIPRALATFE